LNEEFELNPWHVHDSPRGWESRYSHRAAIVCWRLSGELDERGS